MALSPAVLRRTPRGPMKKGRRNGEGKRGIVPRLPPELSCTPVVDHVFRFINTARGQENITVSMLAGACGSVGTITNSKVQPIASTLRVRSIKIWAGIDSTQQSSEVLWNSAITTVEKDNSKVNSTPQNVAQSNVLVSRPPRGTFAANWTSAVTNGSVVLFGISCPIGSVIDVHVVYTIANAYSTPTNITVTTAVLGGLYYLRLDQSAGGNYIPQGVTTTA